MCRPSDLIRQLETAVSTISDTDWQLSTEAVSKTHAKSLETIISPLTYEIIVILCLPPLIYIIKVNNWLNYLHHYRSFTFDTAWALT